MGAAQAAPAADANAAANVTAQAQALLGGDAKLLAHLRKRLNTANNSSAHSPRTVPELVTTIRNALYAFDADAVRLALAEAATASGHDVLCDVLDDTDDGKQHHQHQAPQSDGGQTVRREFMAWAQVEPPYDDDDDGHDDDDDDDDSASPTDGDVDDGHTKADAAVMAAEAAAAAGPLSHEWAALPLHADVRAGIAAMAGHRQMTDIQARALPLLLASLSGGGAPPQQPPPPPPRDVWLHAPTGSGKTLAYLVPAVDWLLRQPPNARARGDTHVLVLCPTRELAVGVHGMLTELCKAHQQQHAAAAAGGATADPSSSSCTTALTHAVVLGGRPYEALGSPRGGTTGGGGGPNIVIGTPGRVLHHVVSGSLVVRQLRVLVVDDCEHMLDMGFEDTLRDIVKRMPRPPRGGQHQHQHHTRTTILCSARRLPRAARARMERLLCANVSRTRPPLVICDPTYAAAAAAAGDNDNDDAQAAAAFTADQQRALLTIDRALTLAERECARRRAAVSEHVRTLAAAAHGRTDTNTNGGSGSAVVVPRELVSLVLAYGVAPRDSPHYTLACQRAVHTWRCTWAADTLSARIETFVAQLEYTGGGAYERHVREAGVEFFASVCVAQHGLVARDLDFADVRNERTAVAAAAAATAALSTPAAATAAAPAAAAAAAAAAGAAPVPYDTLDDTLFAANPLTDFVQHSSGRAGGVRESVRHDNLLSRLVLAMCRAEGDGWSRPPAAYVGNAKRVGPLYSQLCRILIDAGMRVSMTVWYHLLACEMRRDRSRPSCRADRPSTVWLVNACAWRTPNGPDAAALLQADASSCVDIMHDDDDDGGGAPWAQVEQRGGCDWQLLLSLRGDEVLPAFVVRTSRLALWAAYLPPWVLNHPIPRPPHPLCDVGHAVAASEQQQHWRDAHDRAYAVTRGWTVVHYVVALGDESAAQALLNACQYRTAAQEVDWHARTAAGQRPYDLLGDVSAAEAAELVIGIPAVWRPATTPTTASGVHNGPPQQAVPPGRDKSRSWDAVRRVLHAADALERAHWLQQCAHLRDPLTSPLMASTALGTVLPVLALVESYLFAPAAA